MLDILHLDLNEISQEECGLYIKELAKDVRYTDRFDSLHENAMLAMSRLVTKHDASMHNADGTPIQVDYPQTVSGEHGNLWYLPDTSFPINSAAEQAGMQKVTDSIAADAALAEQRKAKPVSYDGTPVGFDGNFSQFNQPIKKGN